MTILTFEGYSDDVICYSIDGVDDEIDVCNISDRWNYFYIHHNHEKGVKVGLRYAEHNACWGIAIIPYAEALGEPELPLWDFKLSQGDRVYTPKLTIDTNGVDVTLVTFTKD